MKCVFAATTYQFSVQYHPWASVEANAHQDWLVEIDGFTSLYRMLPEPGSDRRSNDTCAVFVPSRHNAELASTLVAAFKAAHPGIIPARARFDFADAPWWKRGPRRYRELPRQVATSG